MNEYCLMYDGVFYNLKSESFSGAPIISEVGLSGFLITYFSEDEAECAKLGASHRRYEYEELGLPVPDEELLSIIPELQVVSTCEVSSEIDAMGFELLRADDLY